MNPRRFLHRWMMAWLGAVLAASAVEAAGLTLRPARTDAFDLEISGRLALPGRTNGFLTRADLRGLGTVRATNAHDGALGRAVVYTGIPVRRLLEALPVDPACDVIFTICADGYAAHLTSGYLQAFDPLLILELDGRSAEEWGRSVASGVGLGPYYINVPDFTPRPGEKAGGLDEGRRYPYAVTRLECTTAALTLDRLRPPPGSGPAALEGYRLAVRDCLSCHDHEGFGGINSNRPWLLLKTWSRNTNYFRRYVREPRKVQPTSRMPGFSHYGGEALDVLQAYFGSLPGPGGPATRPSSAP
ncbi:MAG: hypothetical protein ACKO3N_01220 [Verrucomicrobiota bacterium]